MYGGEEETKSNLLSRCSVILRISDRDLFGRKEETQESFVIKRVKRIKMCQETKQINFHLDCKWSFLRCFVEGAVNKPTGNDGSVNKMRVSSSECPRARGTETNIKASLCVVGIRH